MISIFDLFSIGLGPSSSHTVGPMRAAQAFVNHLKTEQLLHQTQKVTVEIFGSLAFTGTGHSTDKAIIAGLTDELPESIDPTAVDTIFDSVKTNKQLALAKTQMITFEFEQDFIFNKDELLPYHTNGMRFRAFNDAGKQLQEDIFYSIGGGFIVRDGDELSDKSELTAKAPHQFNNTAQLLEICEQQQLTIAQVMLANEAALSDETTVKQGILKIANVMRQSILNGCNTEGILPGVLKVQRRAPELFKKLSEQGKPDSYKDIATLDWLNMFAIAVNEENAACKRVVTAPTNGAAGVLPAVMHYYESFYPDVTDDDIINFLLTAAAIAVLYKKGASISAAEVGCQGEVGVASSMAAGALASALGGSIVQIENAAEIAMEHSLGLTCDPIAGLVQIPCIERNAIGANKSVNVARLALMEDGDHRKISLDKVIATMKRTGHDMSEMYKETSQGGLAKIRVNVIEC